LVAIRHCGPKGYKARQEQRVYFETGANSDGPLAYITDWANNDARTEGMSYGMMIAVQLDKKREFDALWNWSKTCMLNTDPKNPSVGYFAWSMNTDGTPRSTSAAPDGEEHYAMALYFAAHRWGNGKGIYNYQAEADKILHGMRHHPVLSGTPPFRIHPGDPPFIEPAEPWPSPNSRAAKAEAAKQGKPRPPHRRDRPPGPVTAGPMVAAAAVGSLAATPGAVSKTFLEELWEMPVPSGEQRYFDGMLYLMSMMHVAGEFRVIESRQPGDAD
jgi:oligosaccharide reducing-end xylanase